MEKVVHALTRKALSFEAELKELKDPKHEMSKRVKEKESETKNEASNENISFNHTELKGTTSTPKEKNDKDEKLDFKEEMLSCKDCDYSFKKVKTFKNHMLTKHELHQCKECNEKLPNFMQ